MGERQGFDKLSANGVDAIPLPLLSSAAHSGVARPRTAPELSDVALFALAVAAVWLVRRGLRRRFRRD